MSKRITAGAANPTVKVSARGAARLQDGHVWVYRSDIVSADGVSPGSLITVTDHRGQGLGVALYSSASQIAIRLISREPVADLPALLRKRIAAAIRYREPIIGDTDAYRVIFSEADFLPGLIVDRYHDVLSVQILTQAMDATQVRETIISDLANRLQPASIFERIDPRIRELEQLQDLFGMRGQKLELLSRCFRCDESHQLNFVELVHPQQATGVLARGPCFTAKAR